MFLNESKVIIFLFVVACKSTTPAQTVILTSPRQWKPAPHWDLTWRWSPWRELRTPAESKHWQLVEMSAQTHYNTHDNLTLYRPLLLRYTTKTETRKKGRKELHSTIVDLFSLDKFSSDVTHLSPSFSSAGEFVSAHREDNWCFFPPLKLSLKLLSGTLLLPLLERITRLFAICFARRAVKQQSGGSIKRNVCCWFQRLVIVFVAAPRFIKET